MPPRAPASSESRAPLRTAVRAGLDLSRQPARLSSEARPKGADVWPPGSALAGDLGGRTVQATVAGRVPLARGVRWKALLLLRSAGRLGAPRRHLGRYRAWAVGRHDLHVQLM